MNIEAATEKVLLALEHLDKGLGTKGFWSFDGESEGAVPDEGGQDSECATHSEHNRVIIHLR